MAEKPEQLSMTGAGNSSQFVPYTPEQKREYAKQFTAKEIQSYRKGQRNAYAHMGNIGRREANYIYGNLQKDAATPPAEPPKPASTRRKNTTNK